jgi:DNA-binding response OmpR family regulator
LAKVLIVEDDARMSKELARWLSGDGHTVDSAATGQDALQMLTNYSFDIAVLDLGLPDMDGSEVLRKHRAAGGRTPIIILTGVHDSGSKTRGLDSGADDYVVKPYDPEELSARIRSVLRRTSNVLSDSLTIGDVTLNMRDQLVLVNNVDAQVTKREYAILEYLMRHPNRCFSSQELIDAVWPTDTESSEDAVRACMKRLRRKLAGDDQECIVTTIPGAGYTVRDS